MAKINLLPWRDELRAQRQREFYVMLAGAAVMLAGTALAVGLIRPRQRAIA